MFCRSICISSAVCALFAGGCAAMHKDKEGDEGNEVTVKFADVPALVKATLTREAGGVAIDSVDRETDDGKTIYEADAVMNGKNYEIKVAGDGMLVSKKLDEEDGEGKKDKEDEEKK